MGADHARPGGDPLAGPPAAPAQAALASRRPAHPVGWLLLALGLLGGVPEAVQHALRVRQWSPDVVLFPHTDVLSSEQRERLTARGIRIVEGTVARLVVHDDRLHGVELRDGSVVPRTAVFVRPRFVPNADLLTSLGCEVDENGWVVHEPEGRTSAAGVWVAGNAADPRAQVTGHQRGRGRISRGDRPQYGPG